MAILKRDIEIDKKTFAKLMGYPHQWLKWSMYPDGVFQSQLSSYKTDSKMSSEQYRYETFCWWLQQDLSFIAVQKLIKLSWYDPDEEMGNLMIRMLTKTVFNYNISKEAFLKLLNYPSQWLGLDMYPDELFQLQLSYYDLGSERASEHYRCSAFYWWLHQKLNSEIIRKYTELTYLDPDSLMGESARQDLEKKIANLAGQGL